MEQEQNTPQGGAIKKNSMNFAIGAVALVAVLFLVGYIMNFKQDKPEIAETTTQTTTPEVDAATVALSSQGSSDDLVSISADLQATDMNSLNDTDKI